MRDAGELPFDLREEPEIAALSLRVIQEVCLFILHNDKLAAALRGH